MSSQVAEDTSVETEIIDGSLRLSTAHETFDLPAIWLRDSSTDSESRDPVSGQRLFNIVDLPRDVRVTDAQVTDTGLEIVFGPDGHTSVFDLPELLANARTSPVDARNETSKILWRTTDDVPPVKRTNWDTYRNNPAPVLRAVADYGFAVLSDVPTEEDQVLQVAETFGYVRETNYGKLFNVRIEKNANNLAFTPLPISPHTDNPYRDPVPTMQLLHCLSNAAEGGDSGLVDGFAVAAQLREKHPQAFHTLTNVKVAYRFDDNDTHLHSVTPLIELDATNNVCGIRFNNRSMIVPAMEPTKAKEFYDAYRTFAEMIYAPEAELTFRLNDGDCLIFDNTRLLHSRTAFAAVGGRHLQGTYADLDGMLSTLTSLEGTS